MSERGRGKARGRAGRGGEVAGQQTKRPGPHPQPQGGPPQYQPGPPQHQPGPPQHQAGPPRPRPQPPSAWGAPSAAPAVRAGMPTPAAGRAFHRTTPSTHDHPGDVDIQQRMTTMTISKYTNISVTKQFSLFMGFITQF